MTFSIMKFSITTKEHTGIQPNDKHSNHTRHNDIQHNDTS
jgi:hypothetical protein